MGARQPCSLIPGGYDIVVRAQYFVIFIMLYYDTFDLFFNINNILAVQLRIQF